MFFCGCALSRAPQIIHFNNLNEGSSTKIFDSSTWLLEGLKPIENIILIRRQIVPISIRMGTHGDGDYILEISANEKKLNPFILTMNSGSGEIDFSGQIIWYIKARGRCELVTIALYKVERTRLCKTEVKTLLKQFTRRYNVKHYNKKS